MREAESAVALPGFLNAIAQTTDSQGLVPALFDGPLHPYRVTAAWIGERRDGKIEVVAEQGFPPAMIDRYRVISLDLDAPAPLAVQNGEILHARLSNVLAQFPALHVDQQMWQQLIVREGGDAWLVSVPILNRGRTIGIYGFVAPPKVHWEMADSRLLLAIGSAIGLWLSSQGASQDHRNRATHEYLNTGEVPLLVTQRQLEILGLVAQGKSNSAIAATLGYSTSTVKIEISRAMRSLRSANRLDAVATARRLNLLGDVQS